MVYMLDNIVVSISETFTLRAFNITSDLIDECFQCKNESACSIFLRAF